MLGICGSTLVRSRERKENNMFYIIGVIVVVLFIAGFLGLR
jgi:hypothetical protein